jgi:hypothetical protein
LWLVAEAEVKATGRLAHGGPALPEPAVFSHSIGKPDDLDDPPERILHD